MRYLLLVLITILVLTPGLVGCGQDVTTYYNREFGYSVEMPKKWEVVEEPVNIVGHRLKDTIGFRSELSPEADWVYVEVRTGESAYSATSKLRLTSDWSRVYEYGKNGYVHETRLFPEKTRRITYYIEHNNRLYVITFNKEETCKKAYVSIDGYGKVNY